MTVGELRQFIEDLDDDMEVVVDEYNSGYGGLFRSGAAVVEPDADSHSRVGTDRVLVIATQYQ